MQEIALWTMPKPIEGLDNLEELSRVPSDGPETVKDSPLRLEYGSPEAVHGFLLSAYRPPALPPKQGCGAAQREEVPLPMRSQSIASPPIHRTDIPLVSLVDKTPQVSPRSFKSTSLPKGGSERLDLHLAARSGSAPPRVTLKVSELWANIPETPTKNPFEHVLDEGVFFD